ncbi:MAG TPA: uracil-DNA glycosylase [Candidatus Methylomirabilis sp.]|nr:uracil-DNA glycosylase [Candidatus Methylomirabilis sp.]
MRRRKNPLESLRAAVVACRRCPRLVTYREQVAREKVRRYRDEEYWGKPIPGFGDPEARLLVVGLAPAAHGGNRTGRIFTGDRSGDFLYRALYRAGFANQPLSRHRDDGLVLRDCYITAAVRCAPPDNKPSLIELSTCRPYLIEEIRQLSHLRVVVTLGHIAFGAFLKAWGDVGRSVPSPRPFFAHGAKNILADGVVLLASYHPSQQNTQTGRLTSVMFQQVFTAARRLLAEPRAQKEARPRMV